MKKDKTKFDINGKIFDIAELIIMKYPTASFTIGEDISTLQWFSTDLEKPKLSDIEQWVKDWNASKVAPVKDWVKLLDLVTGSKLFFKGYAASKVTLSANTAFTLLITAITNTKNESTLVFALTDLVTILKTSAKLEKFTEEELEEIADILNVCGFNGTEIITKITEDLNNLPAKEDKPAKLVPIIENKPSDEPPTAA
jgi:hypothetical protein